MEKGGNDKEKTHKRDTGRLITLRLDNATGLKITSDERGKALPATVRKSRAADGKKNVYGGRDIWRSRVSGVLKSIANDKQTREMRGLLPQRGCEKRKKILIVRAGIDLKKRGVRVNIRIKGRGAVMASQGVTKKCRLKMKIQAQKGHTAPEEENTLR